MACIDSFKRYRYDSDCSNEPSFPYPDIEEWRQSRKSKMENDYPVMEIHNEEWNKLG